MKSIPEALFDIQPAVELSKMANVKWAKDIVRSSTGKITTLPRNEGGEITPQMIPWEDCGSVPNTENWTDNMDNSVWQYYAGFLTRTEAQDILRYVRNESYLLNHLMQ